MFTKRVTRWIKWYIRIRLLSTYAEMIHQAPPMRRCLCGWGRRCLRNARKSTRKSIGNHGQIMPNIAKYHILMSNPSWYIDCVWILWVKVGIGANCWLLRYYIVTTRSHVTLADQNHGSWWAQKKPLRMDSNPPIHMTNIASPKGAEPPNAGDCNSRAPAALMDPTIRS